MCGQPYIAYICTGLVTRMCIVCLDDDLTIQGNPNNAPLKIENALEVRIR